LQLNPFSDKAKLLFPFKHRGMSVPGHLTGKEPHSEIGTRNETKINE